MLRNKELEVVYLGYLLLDLSVGWLRSRQDIGNSFMARVKLSIKPAVDEQCICQLLEKKGEGSPIHKQQSICLGTRVKVSN